MEFIPVITYYKEASLWEAVYGRWSGSSNMSAEAAFTNLVRVMTTRSLSEAIKETEKPTR